MIRDEGLRLFHVDDDRSPGSRVVGSHPLGEDCSICVADRSKLTAPVRKRGSRSIGAGILLGVVTAILVALVVVLIWTHRPNVFALAVGYGSCLLLSRLLDRGPMLPPETPTGKDDVR